MFHPEHKYGPCGLLPVPVFGPPRQHYQRVHRVVVRIERMESLILGMEHALVCV